MGFFRRNAFPLSAAALLLVSGGSFAATRSAQEAALTDQEQRIEELQGGVADLEEAQEERENEVAGVVQGTDTARLDADEELIGDVLDTALTWETHAEYEDARSAMMTVYGLNEDSAFMTAFLPVAPVNVDREGNEYALIDLLGLDSRVGDFRTELLSVQGAEYSYLVLVDVRTTSDDGEASASNTATVLLTTDGDGGVSDVEGYAATSPVRSAGPD
ncbi:hypothetical protein [Nocardiopsis sp. NRRL B-16309]|uniref:hypothetical protein n=1 Tax=Nocardiopsis sp. NRRL B-16309 TaxID=1519494 RepID=UPI0006AE1A78|nr:hypothetical protein [Nocardiopsis sp. NRRL B-16309]KOX14015.1 hypothetical protein ADL05_17385 [Nocardiopsis sp. NRRL B-16309]